VNELNPKPLVIRPPKVPIPPEGQETQKNMRNQRYVLRSRKASNNCGQLNLDTFVPVLFSLSSSRAINRSSPFLRNLAVVGELGRSQKTTGAKKTVKAPMKRKIP